MKAALPWCVQLAGDKHQGILLSSQQLIGEYYAA